MKWKVLPKQGFPFHTSKFLKHFYMAEEVIVTYVFFFHTYKTSHDSSDLSWDHITTSQPAKSR